MESSVSVRNFKTITNDITEGDIYVHALSYRIVIFKAFHFSVQSAGAGELALKGCIKDFGVIKFKGVGQLVIKHGLYIFGVIFC